MIYVLANFAAGVAGLFCTFGSIDGVIRYFSDPAEHRAAAAEAGVTLIGVAGTFLKPFLGFAFVMVWCNWADRWGRSGSPARRLATTVALIIPALVSYATFNYNRGSFIAPLVSITAVYLARVQRASLLALAGFGSAVLGLVIMIGLYRASGVGLNVLAGDASARQELTQKLKLGDEIQIYGQAPQFLAFILEQSEYGKNLYLGTTLISSVMHPVPVLGESFRATSGPSLYNEMIYGKNGFSDQIIPFQGELFLNFHIPGIIAGYWLLGLVTARTPAGVPLGQYFARYVRCSLRFLLGGVPDPGEPGDREPDLRVLSRTDLCLPGNALHAHEAPPAVAPARCSGTLGERENWPMKPLRVCVVGGIYDRSAEYRSKRPYTPETILRGALPSRGMEVTEQGHRGFRASEEHDIVHVHHLGKAALVMASAPPGLRFVFTSHDPRLMNGYQVSWRRLASFRFVVRRADAVVRSFGRRSSTSRATACRPPRPGPSRSPTGFAATSSPTCRGARSARRPGLRGRSGSSLSAS